MQIQVDTKIKHNIASILAKTLFSISIGQSKIDKMWKIILLMIVILTLSSSSGESKLFIQAQNSPNPQPSQISPTCPNDCNHRGNCVSGKCQCIPGYSGVECEFIMIHTSFLSVIGVLFGACGVTLGVTCFCVGLFALVSSVIQKRRLNSAKYQIMIDEDSGNDHAVFPNNVQEL
jgi:hypothetical protein